MRLHHLLFLLLIGSSLSGQSLRQLFTEATQAYEENDYETFLDRIQSADSLRPNHPTILYNLGAAYSLNNQTQNGLEALERSVWLNASNGFEEDEDFVSLHEIEAYQTLVSLAAEMRSELRISTEAFSLQDNSLHPEDVAYDPVSGTFFIGSVRQGKIIKYTSAGLESEFAADPSLWSIMGMTVDEERGLLWACTVPAPEMLGYADSMENQSAIVALDLTSGEIKHRYDVSAPGIWLGDLILTKTGVIYATSSSAAYPAIYRLANLEADLEEYLHLPDLISLQGLCLDTNEQQLFFSDYRYGLFKLDVATKELIHLHNATPHSLKGIDGLYYYQEQLIAIHNGLQPMQVTAYTLNERQTEIIGFHYLDRALPEMEEPTLGVVVGDDLYYVVNSPWGAYSRDKELQTDMAKQPLVLKLHLPRIE